MGPLRLLVALSVLASSAVLFTQAAPTDVLGPPRTLEGDTDVNPPAVGDGDNKRDTEEEVTTDERYYRVYENGTIEFKTALSNGHIQYQKISNKVVDGKTIQVYEGYVSIRYADGRYGTSYYIADENGYRRTKVEVDTKPPVLPKSGPNPAGSENEQEARSPGGTNVLAEEPEAPVPPTTEGNIIIQDTTLPVLPSTEVSLSESETTPTAGETSTLPTTEDGVKTSAEDERVDVTVPVLPSTEVSLSESETTPTAGETSTLPTIEDGVKTSAEDERVDVTTVLPTTDVTKSDAEDLTDTTISGIDDLATSTQYPTLPVSKDIEKKVTELPLLEETLTTTEGDLGGIKTDDDNEAITTTTEDSSIDAEPTGLPISTHKIEEERSGAILPTTEGAITTVTEESSNTPTEDNIPITLTEAPTVEENASKSSEDLASNTELTAINDDEYLDPITETRTSSQEEIITTEPTSRDEDIEATTLLLEPKTEAPGLSSTIASALPDADINSGESEASTELPGTLTEALPVTEETSSDDSKYKATTDASYIQSSTGVPALPVTEEISRKANEASTTDLPTLAVSEETSINHAEDGVIQNEASTPLPTLDETSAGEDRSVETPDGLVNNSEKDNSILSEVSTELPVDDENLGLSTEAAVSSSRWPALPLVDNASTELPVLESASVNATKAVGVNKADQLGLEKELEASTGLPTPSEESDFPEEDNTTPASDEKLETVAKVEEVPNTEEGAIKTA